MVGVDHHVVRIRESAEIHALELLHFFHAAHKLGLGNDNRVRFGRQRLGGHSGAGFGSQSFEHFFHRLFFAFAQYRLALFVFLNEVVHGVGIHAHKKHVAKLVFQLLDKMVVNDGVHHQHVVFLFAASADKAVVRIGAVGVQQHHFVVLVGLKRRYFFAIFVNGKVFAFRVFEQHKLLRFFIKLFVGNHTVFHKNAQVAPLAFVSFAVFVEQFLQFFGHLPGDVAGDFFHVLIALERAARNVERDVRRVNDAVQQHQEFGDDFFHIVGDVDLVGVELDFVALRLDGVVQLGEIQNARQVKRVVNVEVDPEHWRLTVRVQFVVEIAVILVRQLGRLLFPDGRRVVDDVVHLYFHLFLFFSFGRLACFVYVFFARPEFDGYGQELAVFFQQSFDAAVF